MREQAGVIQKEVTTLLQDVVRLDGRVEKLRIHFNQADKDIALIETSARKVMSRSEKIENLQLEESETAEAALDGGQGTLPGS